MKRKLIGPFRQLLTMRNIALKGALQDSQLEVIVDGGLYIEDDKIEDVGPYQSLKEKYKEVEQIVLSGQNVCLPGYIDCHTHIAFDGNRANDFALRNAGSSYLEIAAAGGGIWSTVQHTRSSSEDRLAELTALRAKKLLKQGITTIEVKSGYGLNIEQELKTLQAIRRAAEYSPAELIPTCLAAHMKPKDYEGTAVEYLEYISESLFPILKEEKLTKRIDAFVEQSAFSVEELRPYLLKAKEMGFEITLHADQFTTSGSALAVEIGAVSADHLEASTQKEIQLLADSDVVAVALPAASLGLGCTFTPARALLDAGAALAIATDWNPGSAPMGQLVASASILATMQKLTNAEVLSALTYRAAFALGLTDRGRLDKGQLADFIIYSTDNYQNITYQQGTLQPSSVWKKGKEVYSLSN